MKRAVGGFAGELAEDGEAEGEGVEGVFSGGGFTDEFEEEEEGERGAEDENPTVAAGDEVRGGHEPDGERGEGGMEVAEDFLEAGYDKNHDAGEDEEGEGDDDGGCRS